jgi:hypothetical protein
MTEINPVEFGAIKAELAAQRRDIDRIVGRLDEMAQSVQKIEKTLSEARGGWKALIWVSGISGSFGAAMTWVANHLGRG